jgi:hypothetical protein
VIGIGSTVGETHPRITATGGACWRRPVWNAKEPVANPYAVACFRRCQPAANLAQRLSSAQLAEQHGHELPATSEATRMLFGFVFTGRCLKDGS